MEIHWRSHAARSEEEIKVRKCRKRQLKGSDSGEVAFVMRNNLQVGLQMQEFSLYIIQPKLGNKKIEVT